MRRGHTRRVRLTVPRSTLLPAPPVRPWPAQLWLLRHGESAGNVARDAAEASGADRIDIAIRDMDVPLSDRGREQACAVGEYLRSLDPGERPEVVFSSPYVRAHDTARIAMERAGLRQTELVDDERLREREFGILDRLTRRGIGELYPHEAAARRLYGKFYHRPAGGESWIDVALRVRSTLDTLRLDHGGRRVLLVTHQVVILVFRYVLEQLGEHELLAIDRAVEVANCSLTRYRWTPPAPGMELVDFNDVEHVAERAATVTAEPNPPEERT